MAKQRININGEPWPYIQRLAAAKKDFTVKLSSASGQVIMGDKVISFGDPWKPQDLGLFSRTRAALNRRESHPEPPVKVDYIGINPPEDKTFQVYDNVCALDISAAYNSAAEILGFFNKELGQYHREHDKLGRLKAFGATAKRAEVFVFKKGEIMSNDFEESPLRPYFLNAAKYVGNALLDVRSHIGEGFIFFWVDCALFKDTPENRQKALEVFEGYGFDVHFEAIDFLIYRRRTKHHEIERISGKDRKIYNFPIFDNSKFYKLAKANKSKENDTKNSV